MKISSEVRRSLGGPFLSAIRAIRPDAKERSGQAALMLDLSECLDIDPAERTDRNNEQRRAIHYTAEVGTGVGKTYAILALSTIAAAVTGRRTIVGTHTRILRDELDAQGQMFVSAFCDAMGYRPVTIGAIRPLSSSCSPGLAEHYADTADGEEARTEARAYRDWVFETYRSGKIPTPQDWTSDGRTLDFVGVATQNEAVEKLIVRGSELSTLPEHDDPGIATTVTSAMSANMEARDNADIIVVTHALVLKNGIDFGQTLGTATRDSRNSEATIHRYDLILDEADSFLSQAGLVQNEALSLAQIEKDIGKRAASGIRKVLRSALGRSEQRIIRTDEELRTVSEALVGGSDRKILKKLEALSKDDSNVAMASRAHQTAGRILAISSVHEQAGNGIGAVLSDAGYTLWIGRQEKDLVIGMDATSPERLLNRSWVNNNLHAFDHVVHLSGTLVDLPSGYSTKTYHYHRDVGLNERRDTVHRNIGHAPHLIIKPSTSPLQALDLATGDLRPISRDRQSLDESYWKNVAEHIGAFSAGGDRRRLVLLQSYAALDLLGSLLMQKGLSPLVQNGSSIDELIDTLAESSEQGKDEIVLSLKWQGTNFVRGGKTVIDHVIIPQMPIRPPGRLHPQRLTLERTAWKMRNGIGRMYRHEGDTGRISILDPRFVLPKNVIDQRVDNVVRTRYEPIGRAVLGIGSDGGVQLDSGTRIGLMDMKQTS